MADKSRVAGSLNRRIKLVLLGDGCVGKSCLIHYACYNKPTPTYITPLSFEPFVTDICIDGHTIVLDLWDTPGQEDYDRLRPVLYSETDGVLIVFDVVNAASFENVVEKWLPEVEHFLPNVKKLLVGNKCDLRLEATTDHRFIVSQEQAEKVAKQYNMMYIETDAVAGKNVHKALQLITEEITLELEKELGKILRKNLVKAKKKHGTIPVRFLKLFFTGSGAAGKTSFIRLLLGKTFIHDHHSTNVVHTNHAVSLKMATFHQSSANDKVKWVEFDSNLELSFLRLILLPPASPKLQIVDRERNVNISPDSVTLAKSTESAIDHQFTSTQQKSSVKHWIKKRLETPVKSSHLSTFDGIVKEATLFYPKAVLHQPEKVLNIITLLDTGGQPEYIHLLPTINIYPTVTFVIHDLSRNLNDKVLVEYSQHGKHTFAPYHLSYSNLDLIKLLMSAANDYIEKPDSDIPKLVTIPGTDKKSYICLVGTHADKVSKEKVKEVGNELNTLVNMTHCEAAVWQNSSENVLFAVNNATAGQADSEDPMAKVIRRKIETLAEGKEVYDLPITWMLFQLEIQEVCSKNGKNYISFKDCIDLARETGLMHKEKEVKSVLLYHHLLGVLIYFEKVPGLCDYVIVDHQWWFDKLSNIICTTFHQDSFNHHAVQKLKYQGLLSEELLQHVEWKDDIKEEFFLSLLVQMRIIAPIVKQNKKVEEYFIPYVLPTCDLYNCNKILDQYGSLQGEPLLVQFRSGFLPRGLFCCLIVELLQHSPKGWEIHFSHKNTHHSFNNMITFVLPNSYTLSLLDKVSFLEAQVRRHLTKDISHIPVHNEAFNYLVYALTEVCIHLNFDYDRLKYGFTCHCDESLQVNHIAILPTTSCSVLYARCTINNAHQFDLSPSQLIWFCLQKLSMLSEHDNSTNHSMAPTSPDNAVKVVSVAEDHPDQILFKNDSTDHSTTPSSPGNAVKVDSVAEDHSDQFPFKNNSTDHSTTPSLPRNAVKVDSLVEDHSDQLPFKIDDRPDMRDLNRHIVEQQAAEWERLGLELGLKDYHIANISKDNEHNPNRSVTCCRAMLAQWLREIPSPTWSKLDDAIKNIKLPSKISSVSIDKREPVMRLLHEIVVPKIAADWSIVADYLEYKVEDKKLIKEKCFHDPLKCCVELLEDWLSSSRGVSPKSWSKLVEVLRQIKSITATTEKIINELEKAGVAV